MKVGPEKLKDDEKDWTGVVVEKPWGEERQLRATKEFSIWRLVIHGGCETSLHCHTEKTALMEVQSGEVELFTFSGARTFRQGECVLIEKGVFHRLKAHEGAVVIELEWPANRRDLVRYADAYGREGREYAS